jgi:hypothetical protein
MRYGMVKSEKGRVIGKRCYNLRNKCEGNNIPFNLHLSFFDFDLLAMNN